MKIHILVQNQISRDVLPIINDGWDLTCFDGNDANRLSILGELNKCLDDVFLCFVSIPIASYIMKNFKHLAKGLMWPSTYEMYDSRNPLYLNEWTSRLPNDMLLNNDVIYSTVGDVLKGVISLDAERVFIKPVSPWKPFAGFDCKITDLQFEMKSYSQINNLDPGTMVAASSYKSIDYIEKRCYAVEGVIVATAPYSWVDIQGLSIENSQVMIDLATNAAEHLQYVGDPWVIDVAMTDTGPKVVEINAVPTSGWYPGLDTNKLFNKLLSLKYF